MTVIYFEEDADINVLTGKTVGLIGYGSLGRPVALNLRDHHVSVLVGGMEEDEANAQADGFNVGTVENVTRQADIIILMLPDEVMTRVYMESIAPNLRRDNTLIFTSAYNVAFGFIEPPPFVDVGLVAPRTIGGTSWEHYRREEGFWSFIAVWQDSSRRAWETTLGIALAMGSLRAGAVEISIEQEAEISQFIQQAVIPAFHNIIVTASHLLVEQGYPPEAVLLDLYLSGKFSDYMQQAATAGLLHAIKQSSLTEQYGTFSRLNRFNELKLERLMEVTLDEIRSGAFAREWAREYEDGQPGLKKLLKQQEALDLWELEQQTLDMMGANSEFL